MVWRSDSAVALEAVGATGRTDADGVADGLGHHASAFAAVGGPHVDDGRTRRGRVALTSRMFVSGTEYAIGAHAVLTRSRHGLEVTACAMETTRDNLGLVVSKIAKEEERMWANTRFGT